MKTEAHIDAIRHARETGAECWQKQYTLDCGWDADSIRATAEQGPSDYDIEALGEDAAEELAQWCRTESD